LAIKKAFYKYIQNLKIPVQEQTGKSSVQFLVSGTSRDIAIKWSFAIFINNQGSRELRNNNKARRKWRLL